MKTVCLEKIRKEEERQDTSYVNERAQLFFVVSQNKTKTVTR